MASQATLDPDQLSQGIAPFHVGAKVLVFDDTASTNDIAAEYSRNPDNHGLVVVAEHQQQGRGRSGNAWLASRGQSLLCSVVLNDTALKAERLSLVSAVAVAETIGPQARIKWPNDILIGGRKACGILLESKPWPSHTAFILGIGINCHQQDKDFPPALRSSATSLDMALKTRTDRIVLARRLFAVLDQWLDIGRQDAKNVVDAWQRVSLLWGQRLTILYQGRSFTGHCMGIDPEQGLVLKLDHGTVRMFDAAHSSIVNPV